MIHYMTTNGLGNAWVGNELRVLAREKIPYVLHSLIRPPQTFFASTDTGAMDRDTRTLYPIVWGPSLRAFVLAPIRFRGRFFAALWNALTGRRETLRARLVGIWHLYVACHWATMLRSEKVTHIHSQWIHSGGTVAMYGAWLLGVPFSFTGHAADLFRERAALLDKIRRATFIICISTFHRDFFIEHGARPEQLHVAYCGIDTSHFSPQQRSRFDGEPYRILASGRLVEKKGLTWLIRACGILRNRGVKFACTIGGNGELEAELRREVRQAGLEQHIEITGKALKQEDIPAFMHGGDVYCLPCVWASDNDVDGLPQMLMEAMACGLPAVSTRLVGIPDLILHEQTGLLVEPKNAEQLADALLRLMQEPETAKRLAKDGRQRVLDVFDLSTCLQPLIEQFRARLEPP
jgi:glycosyltransferase involved in cell wall biosynthesis